MSESGDIAARIGEPRRKSIFDEIFPALVRDDKPALAEDFPSGQPVPAESRAQTDVQHMVDAIEKNLKSLKAVGSETPEVKRPDPESRKVAPPTENENRPEVVTEGTMKYNLRSSAKKKQSNAITDVNQERIDSVVGDSAVTAGHAEDNAPVIKVYDADVAHGAPPEKDWEEAGVGMTEAGQSGDVVATSEADVNPEDDNEDDFLKTGSIQYSQFGQVDLSQPYGGNLNDESKLFFNAPNTTFNDGEIFFAKPLLQLVSTDDKFSPVDVCKTPRYTFATSQATNQVGCFAGTTFKGVLQRGESRYFDSPRNLVSVSGVMSMPKDVVVVLDNIGFHVFEETGGHIRTFFKGDGYKYRGLATYFCHNDSEGQPKIVTIDQRGSRKKLGVSLEVMGLSGPNAPNKVTVEKRFRISQTMNMEDPQCRFLAVYSDCDPGFRDCCHYAIVPGMKSRKLYKVDLKTGESSIMELVGNKPQDRTFVPSFKYNGDYHVYLSEPTGVAIDNCANILVADRAMNRVEVFHIDGSWLKTIRLPISPVGIEFDRDSECIYVSDCNGKVIEVYKA